MFKGFGARSNEKRSPRLKSPRKIKSMGVDFSVVVATKNRAGVLLELIRSLARQRTGPGRFEILIVDNGSRDQTAAEVYRVGAKFPELQIRYLFLPVANASLARNEGAAQAKGKYLAFLDDDCRVAPDWLQQAMRNFRLPGIRVLGGPALVPNSKIYPRWFRGDWEDLRHPISRGWLRPDQYLFEGNFFIRRLDYLALGGMKTEMGPSSRRFAFHEGTELQNRIRHKWPGKNLIFYDSRMAVSHLIDPGKVRLRSRWKRMLIAGLDHPRAHACRHAQSRAWIISILPVRLFWRGLRVGFSLLPPAAYRKKSWRANAYNHTGREIYRWGETLGSMLLFSHHVGPISQTSSTQTALWSRIRRPLLNLWRVWQKQNRDNPLPLQVVRSTPSFLDSHSQGAGKILWSKRGETNRLVASQGSGTLSHPLLVSTGNFRQPKLWLARVPMAMVYGPSVAVVTQNRALLSDVSVEWSKDPEDHGIMRKFFLPNPRELSGNCFLMGSTGGKTFHHWMIDVLPRIRILQGAGHKTPDWYLVNGLQEKFQRESLEILGIYGAKCIEITKGAAFRCERLLLPSLPCSLGHPSRMVCEFLKETILPDSGRGNGRTGRKILLGRADTLSRQVIRWNEIRQVLISLGFEEILASQMSLREQACAFHSADWVVGVHGAALTNLAFCRAGTKVVEIFGWNYVNPCYRDLCAVAGLEHYGVVGRGPGDGPEIVYELHDASGEIHVQPEEVLRALREAGMR